MSNPFDDIVAKATAALANVAETSTLDREWPANAGAARYVWIPVAGSFTGANKQGRNVLDTIALSVDVHCWGATDQSTSNYDSDFDAAWYLFTALMTVLPSIMGGRNFVPKDLKIGKPGWISYGISVVLSVDLRVDVLAADFSASGPYGKITNFVETTTTPPNAFLEATPALSTPGDGAIEGTES